MSTKKATTVTTMKLIDYLKKPSSEKNEELLQNVVAETRNQYDLALNSLESQIIQKNGEIIKTKSLIEKKSSDLNDMKYNGNIQGLLDARKDKIQYESKLEALNKEYQYLQDTKTFLGDIITELF